jgi:uncharacterized protein (DUF362 family)/NAD-dependent dihydropyrimidine dehydrogenase PreA subunit
MVVFVSVKKCENYSKMILDSAINEVIELAGGLRKIVNQGDRVLLKPNILSVSSSESAINTHPAVIGSVIRYLKELNAIPFVAEASGFVASTEDAFEKSGIGEVCKDEEVEFHSFSKEGFSEVDVPDGEIFDKIYIAKDILNADVVISLPKLKTHVQAKYTGAVKNFFGAIPQSQRKYLHRIGTFESLSAGIVDIYSIAKPDFALMDAVVSMDGNGPSNGNKRNTGFLLASSDCVALDSAACKLIGFDDDEVLHLIKANNRGLGYSDFREIQIVGDAIGDSFRKFKKPRIQGGNIPTLLMDMAFYFYKREPFVAGDLCIACGYCKNVCPTSAVTIEEHAIIDQKKCIECFCCYEVCPQEAIELKRSFLYRVLSKFKARKD